MGSGDFLIFDVGLRSDNRPLCPDAAVSERGQPRQIMLTGVLYFSFESDKRLSSQSWQPLPCLLD